MTKWLPRARLGVFALLSTITLSGLAACGSDEPTTSSGDPGDDGPYESPLDEYLGGGAFAMAGGGMVRMAAPMGERDEQKERQVEDAVAACMRDQGFEYVPHIPDESVGEEFEEAESLDPDEYAKQYGYGVSTIGFGGSSDDEDDDPNTAIRAGLSASAQEAYDQALWGDMAVAVAVTEEAESGDEQGTAPAPGPEEGEPGCKQTARDEILGAPDETAVDLSEFSELFDDLQALEERILSDPEAVAAIDAWSTCMAEAGYAAFDSLEEPESSIMERMTQLMGGSEGDAGSDEEPSDEEPSDEESDDGGPTLRRFDPSTIDEEALAQLKDDEIATAVADRECRAEHVDAVEQEVRGAMEQEFVDANREILERYRDAVAGATP